MAGRICTCRSLLDQDEYCLAHGWALPPELAVEAARDAMADSGAGHWRLQRDPRPLGQRIRTRIRQELHATAWVASFALVAAVAGAAFILLRPIAPLSAKRKD